MKDAFLKLSINGRGIYFLKIGMNHSILSICFLCGISYMKAHLVWKYPLTAYVSDICENIFASVLSIAGIPSFGLNCQCLVIFIWAKLEICL